MTSFQRGWRRVPLGAVVTTKSGNSKLIKGKLSKEPSDGLFPAFSASGQDVWHEQGEHSGDAIIISAVGARCGKCFLASGDWSAVANTHIVWPSEGVNPKYLWYLLNDEDFWVKGGTAQPFVKVKASLDIEIPVPPLDEQRRLVEAIETHLSHLDAGVESLHRAKRNIERMRAAVLKVAVEGKLVPQDPDDEPAVGQTLPRDFAAPYPLPHNWNWARTGDLTQVQGGIQKQPKRKPMKNAYPYLRVANVLRGRLDLDEVYEFELFEGELSKYRLLAGDLLVVEGNGSLSQIGRSALWSAEIEDCVHQNHIIRVRPGPSLVPRYVDLFWNSPRAAAALAQVASSTSGLYTLSTAKVKSVPIAVPPVNEQERIATEVDRQMSILNALTNQAEAANRRSDILRSSVLADAFAGRLVDDASPQVNEGR